MKREEAISLLGWFKSKTNREDDLEAIDMAIKALQGGGGDLISRADAINAFWEDSEIRTAEVRATLKALPSAEAVQDDECDHCVYKWGTKGGDDE